MVILFIFASVVFSLVLFALLRLRSITPYFNPTPAPTRARSSKTPPHVLILLGSGGHTAEMLSLLSALSSASKFRRTYVFSSGDSFSAKKAVNFETHMRQKDDPTKQSKTSSDSTYTLLEIPRARNVGQSWLTTPWSCIICILGCLRAFNSGGAPPDLVVCNGPGSAVMMVAVCFLYKFFGLCATRTIYVESFARVNSLSLSGWLLYLVVDRFIVQWPGLQEKFRRAEYHGILI